MKEKSAKTPSLALISVIYLAGIFMGAIDTGIVTPARTIIQNNLMVDSKTGIWMITIYTLAYAASIPVMGKLADRFGRKTIYITSILLFGVGSLLCGLSHYFGSFELLIAARAIQAIGGGGIMPVATAEFGTSFPPEKRGMALGLIGGVYGIANIFGSLAGSAILDAFGTENWQYIFFINIPISIFIILAGFFALPNNKVHEVKKIDGFGTLIIVAMVLSLLYGLKQIDFFDFSNTITSINTYPFLIAFAVLLPVFILIEKRAEDPIMNLSYFTSGRIVTTFAVAFASGFVMMGIVFIPQFCENSLMVPSGDGGYFTVILGLLSGVSAMLSGKLIDKIGAKLVLVLGFSISILGALFLIFVATVYPSMLTVVVSLMLLGFGMGFTIGAPVNYMMLENVKDSEANSGLATLSLIRSIGTSIAPAIMVGFLAYAGTSTQANLMSVLPNEVSLPPLPYAEDISNRVNDFKNNPNTSETMGDMDIPDLASMQTIKLDFSGDGDYVMPEAVIEKLQSSDVTTIVEITKYMAETMFNDMSPEIISEIQSGLNSGCEGVAKGITQIDSNISELQTAYNGISQEINGMKQAISAQNNALYQLQSISALTAQMPSGQMPGNITSIADIIPAPVKSQIPQNTLNQLAEIETVEELNAKISELQSAIAMLNGKIASSIQSQNQMSAAIAQITAVKIEMQTLLDEMNELNSAVPASFDTAKESYLAEIDVRSEKIETVYQGTINEGYQSIYLTVIVSAALALILLVFYRKKKQPVENAR